MFFKLFIFGLFINSILTKNINNDRSFIVDYENDRFLKDGENFRFISGALHYFRLPNEYWEDRLIKYRKAGLNTVQTYIEWSIHEPLKNKFDFDGDKNLFKFIEIAQKVGLNVILRPGPYICAERDNGGLPFWLKQFNPDIRIRSSDPKYFKHVEDWFKVLLPKLKPYLYENGGPVIMVQLENEYGSYFECDAKYLVDLRDLVKKELSNNTVLFTTDGPDVNKLKCAMIPDVLPAIDFGTNWDVDFAFKQLRKVMPKGPLINNEFYPGWLDHWAEKHNKVSSQDTCSKLDQILSQNASINFYMFYGGTSFGFKAGANGDENSYQADTTSYDYNAPINEYGNLTQKYLDVQKTLSKFAKIEEINKDDYVNLIVPQPVDLSLLKENLIEIITKNQPVVSEDPKTFESLGIDTGYVAYKTQINFKPSVPAKLQVTGLKDRAYIYIDNIFQGILDRQTHIDSSTVISHNGSTLVILVENQGRINFDRSTGETKGISKVTLGKTELKNWQHFGTENWDEIYNQVLKLEKSDVQKQFYKPRFFKGEFVLNEERKDTILNMADWSKGFVFINGKNLGRYWSTTGPQQTLYVPGVWLKNAPESNTIILLEHELDPCFTDCKLYFTNKHEIDSDVPN